MTVLKQHERSSEETGAFSRNATKTSQIAFYRRTDVGPTSAHPLVQCWANGFLTVGPTLAQCRQATGENYILSTASANQMMFIDNFCSVNF